MTQNVIITNEYFDQYEQEVDEDAPTVWRKMNESVSPELYYGNLESSLRREIDSWQHVRNERINDSIQKNITKSLENDLGTQRKYSSFIQCYVRGFVQNADKAGNPSTTKAGNEAMLTIWDPNEDQCSMLKEGAVIQCRNLGVSPSPTFPDGILQLSANKNTKIEQLDAPTRDKALEIVGYQKQSFDPLLFLIIKSKKLCVNEIKYPEVDCKGYLLDFEVTTIERILKLVLYLTDASGLLLRIEHEAYCESDNFIRDLKQMKSRDISERYLMFCNIRLLPFDHFRGHAVGIWTKFSFSFDGQSKKQSCDIDKYKTSPPTKDKYALLLHQINLGIPIGFKMPKTMSLTFGYITDFTVMRSEETAQNKEEVNRIHMSFDCFGDGSVIDVLIPNNLVQSLLEHSLDNSEPPWQFCDIISKSSLLRKKLVGSSILIRALIQLVEDDNSDFYVLVESSRANIGSLANLYLMKDKSIHHHRRYCKSI